MAETFKPFVDCDALLAWMKREADYLQYNKLESAAAVRGLRAGIYEIARMRAALLPFARAADAIYPADAVGNSDWRNAKEALQPSERPHIVWMSNGAWGKCSACDEELQTDSADNGVRHVCGSCGAEWWESEIVTEAIVDLTDYATLAADDARKRLDEYVPDPLLIRLERSVRQLLNTLEKLNHQEGP